MTEPTTTQLPAWGEAIAKASEIGTEHGTNAADLSGQWADGYTPQALALDCAPDNGYGPDSLERDALFSELCDAYEEAFTRAVEAEIVRVCRYQLGEQT